MWSERNPSHARGLAMPRSVMHLTCDLQRKKQSSKPAWQSAPELQRRGGIPLRLDECEAVRAAAAVSASAARRSCSPLFLSALHDHSVRSRRTRSMYRELELHDKEREQAV